MQAVGGQTLSNQPIKIELNGLIYEVTEDDRYLSRKAPDVSAYPKSLTLGDATSAVVIELQVAPSTIHSIWSQ